MSRHSRTTRKATVAVAVASAAALGFGGLLVGQSATAAPATQNAGVTQTVSRPDQVTTAAAAPVTRAEVLRRAATWLTANNGGPVPYSQTKVWSDGYRQDCSGYVSMTLGLWKPGPNTVGLAGDRSLTTPISLGSLQPGDLLIDADGSNTTRHVVIFEKWTDSSRSSYWAYEQRGTYGTTHRTLSYGLSSGSEYKPYRPVNISDSTTPPPSTGSWPTLARGASGTDVKTAQYLLSGRGYRLAADGAFGPDTDAKVRAFQQAKGLAVDGVIGPRTWSALISTVKEGSSGDAVRAAQLQLNSQGNSLAADGVFGSATASAVRGFQQAKGLTVDGIVGPETWRSLIGG
ncbi:peptidoglycan-binding protein [Streptomyces sp. DH24]|uniref:C40 family peptidase n=1 Tax=Streptomyces sp. DH24 TaxID=3040123 RepID=UPI002442ECBD|nr:peptidoglycan-binding protein [Streptomyces sp. DH24]MDG9717049.1 peptidoglycan-binding protein [Streptomyces sp. DH24]